MAVKKNNAGKLSPEEQVVAYMNNLKHPMKAETETVREIIRNTDNRLSERIKWNAPSYYYVHPATNGKGKPAEEDIVTFGPYKDNKILLVFHHPAVVKIKSPLLEGNYPNRRLTYFDSMNAIKENKRELERIIQEHLKYILKK